MLHKHIEQIIFILILFVPFSEKLRQSRVFQHMNITCNRERSLTREGGARSHALLIYLHFNMHFFFSRSDVSIGFIYYFNVSIAVGI